MGEAARLALLGGDPVVRDTLPRWPRITDTDVEALLRCLHEDHLSAYEVVDGPLFQFERELRARFGVEHALLVSSGTAALQSAIFGLGLRAGDEVVVPASTYPGTGAVALHSGATVCLADVNSETGNPDWPHIEAALSKHTRAVILAHAWGIPADLSGIEPRLAERGIALIEDAARAFGSRCGDREVGTFGAAGAFSFHELKAVPGGEGGLLVTSQPRVYERAVALGHYFRCKVHHHLTLPELEYARPTSLGLNLKIHPLAATLARSQLARLDDRLDTAAQRRAELAAAIEGLPHVRIQQLPHWTTRLSPYGLNVQWRPTRHPAPSAHAVVSALRAEGIHASTAGNAPLHRLPLFRDSGGPNLPGTVASSLETRAFPGAETLHASLVRFPPWVSPQWVESYAAALDKVCRHVDALARWEASEPT